MSDDAQDFEPEDAYDAADPFDAHLAILARIVEALAATPNEGRRVRAVLLAELLDDELGELEHRLEELRDRLERLGH